MPKITIMGKNGNGDVSRETLKNGENKEY